MGKIAVIGDVLLDKYDYCVNRENPESSAPCYTVKETVYKPGGAGNVAANLASLGSEVDLFGVVGTDPLATQLVHVLSSLGVSQKLIFDADVQTIVKERVMSATDGRYHFRKDFEKKVCLRDHHVEELTSSLKDYSLIIISDYDKGLITKELMDKVKSMGVPVIVDPKPAHYSLYKGVFLIKPNIKEAKQMTGLEDDLAAGDLMRSQLGARVLLTRSQHGMSFFDVAPLVKRIDFPSEAKEVFDVTGAGDTVTATLAHFYNKGSSLIDAIKYANIAAGIAVAHVGCYQVKENEILRQ